MIWTCHKYLSFMHVVPSEHFSRNWEGNASEFHENLGERYPGTD